MQKKERKPSICHRNKFSITSINLRYNRPTSATGGGWTRCSWRCPPSPASVPSRATRLTSTRAMPFSTTHVIKFLFSPQENGTFFFNVSYQLSHHQFPQKKKKKPSPWACGRHRTACSTATRHSSTRPPSMATRCFGAAAMAGRLHRLLDPSLLCPPPTLRKATEYHLLFFARLFVCFVCLFRLFVCLGFFKRNHLHPFSLNTPHPHESRAIYINLFQTMAAKLIKIQGPDGFWHSSLADYTEYDNPG